jgi:hypothetical protein
LEVLFCTGANDLGEDQSEPPSSKRPGREFKGKDLLGRVTVLIDGTWFVADGSMDEVFLQIRFMIASPARSYIPLCRNSHIPSPWE